MESCAEWTLTLLQWTVRKLEDGNYNLTLEDAGRLLFIQDDGGKLVGSDTPPPFSWAIRSLGQDSVSYTLVPICLAVVCYS
jgi:hypothetical protein